MQSLDTYVPGKPVIPPILTLLVMITGCILMGFSEDVFYKTFIHGYTLALIVVGTGLVLTVLFYKLQTGKKGIQAKYLFLSFVVNTFGIGGIIVYFLLTINYNQASNERTVQLPVISQGTAEGKSVKTNYVELNYEGIPTELKVAELPGPTVKYVTARLKHGYFGFEVISKPPALLH
ncbi:MAG: hypothetical protein ACTHJ8_08465 [Mucilaginibacter sp.]|jgi:hypothetical protein